MTVANEVPDSKEIVERAPARSRLVRWSLVALLLIAIGSWLSGDIDVTGLANGRRLENLRSFLRDDAMPFPLREKPVTLAALAQWAGGLWSSRGFTGALQTLSISLLAITLAALAGALLAPFAARNVVAARPFEPPGRPDGPRTPGDARRERLAKALLGLVRAFLVFLRAIPEYVWAFLLLAMLGPSAWPAVLALAIHNAGILGKLGAETVENLETPPLRSLAWLGARRSQVTAFAVAPLSLTRFLLYYFYRFETCVREATVLGLLGVVSLGYWIQDARARHWYDEMLFFVALGAGIVLLGDLVSALARSFLRKAA
jgi:phosphonate transport system permease protein